MKIILNAFGQMKSQPMDIPEETGSEFHMVLTEPMNFIYDSNKRPIFKRPAFDTMCTFEYTGKEENGCRIYVLKDIIKKSQ